MDHTFCQCDLYYRPFVPSTHRRHFDEALGYDHATSFDSIPRTTATNIRSSSGSQFPVSSVSLPAGDRSPHRSFPSRQYDKSLIGKLSPSRSAITSMGGSRGAEHSVSNVCYFFFIIIIFFIHAFKYKLLKL